MVIIVLIHRSHNESSPMFDRRGCGIMKKVNKAILIVTVFVILIIIVEIISLTVAYTSVERLVDRNLANIISSPLYSSNADDYINEHRNEFDGIIAMGDKALYHMYSLFESEKDDGLKGVIMVKACIGILGERNKITQWTTPMDWYQKQMEEATKP